jgi:hypothetical protein
MASPSSVPDIIGAVAEECFNALATAAPGSAVVGAATKSLLQRLLEGRLRAAQEVLRTELRAGNKTLVEVAHQDAALAVIYRYLRAAQEGTARVNLTLMARVIGGQIERGHLVADEFLYYADMLAALRREELILLATLYKNWTATDVSSLERDERINKANELTRAELVPQPFKSKDLLSATFSAVSRTGLTISVAAFEGQLYFPSPLMSELVSLCPLSEVLDREP